MRTSLWVVPFVTLSLIVLAGCTKSGGNAIAVETSEEKTAPLPQGFVAQVDENKDAPVVSEPGAKFVFPADTGGKLLSELLPPVDLPKPPPPTPSQQSRRDVPYAIANPAPMLPIGESLPPTIRLAIAKDIAPTLPVEVVPMSFARIEPELPIRLEQPIGLATDIRALDPNLQVEVPRLAQRSVNRASLNDPTDDYSAASVIGAPLPLRTTPAPFVQIDLPNPFENAETIKLQAPITVDPSVVISSVPTPKP